VDPVAAVVGRSCAARVLISALLILSSMLVVSPAGIAVAQPGDNADPPAAATVRLDWPALGLKPEVYLSADSTTNFAVPVPPGLSPTRMQGVIHAPMNIDAGFLEISDGDGRFLGSVGLPPEAAAQAVTPFDVDISGARVRSSTIDLSFTVRSLDDAGGFCGPLQQLSLSDLATVFTGTESPATTIANFFPPVLERVTIYTPANADAAEQQSTLTLVTTLARLYNIRPIAITVVVQPRGANPPPAAQLTRAVVVEAGGPAGLTVERAGSPDAYLRISGSGDELSAQTSLLVNQLQSLAQTPTSRIDQAGSETPLSGDTLTFSQLKLSGKTDVLRTGSLTIGVDRSALGVGRVDSVQVHLLADYTPVPKDDAASVVIRSNGIVVYRAALDHTGVLDATFDLARPAFGQGVNLDFALTYTPQEACGPLLAPLSFQVDPRSTFTMQRGGPPLSGFGAFPSEFSPGFMVALDGSGPDQLSYAARVVGAIARLTSTQLTPQVVDLETAADSDSGALIVASSKAIEETTLNPPLSGDGTTVDLALPTELRADIQDGLGSIQAFADQSRNRSVVLVTSTASWSLVDPLFNYIDGLDGGWSALTGDVLAAGAARVPTNVTIRDTGNTFEPPRSPALPTSLDQWIPIAVGVAVIAAIAVVAAILWSRRRRSTENPPDDGPLAEPEQRV
jgi:hypothetical protein